MFDLFRSREKSVRYILIVLLSLVALSLVITLIPGIGGGFTGSGDANIIAEIGDETVTAIELRQVVQQQLSAGGMQREMIGVYVPLIAQQLISTRAVAYQAERLGFRVSDQETAEIIRSIMPDLFQGGQFAGRDVYAAVLAQQNLTIPAFEANIRRQTLATRLEVMALEGNIVTPQEVEAAYRQKNDRIVMSYAVLTEDKFRPSVTVSTDEVQKMFEANRANYNIPERRSFLIYPVEESRLSARITLPEPELRAAYQAQIDSFRTPERVRVRHILLKTEGKAEGEVAELQKRAEDIRQQILKGANMADLARKFSEDTGSAQQGGDIDWVTRGQTVPEFEQAAFTLRPGQLSDVIKTMYGFHVLRVEAREDARVKPFEEVKAELQQSLVKQRVYDLMQTVADQIRAALLKSPEEADRVAAAHGITPVRTPAIFRTDMVPGIGANQAFSEAAWALQVNGVTPVLTLDSNRLAVARLEQIVPSRPSEFQEVESQLRQMITASKAATLLQEKTKEFEEKLKASGADLAAVARQFGLGGQDHPRLLPQRFRARRGISEFRFEEGIPARRWERFSGPVTTGNRAPTFCKVVEKTAR
jgi:Parvulin-like peptidyl-prolyl isomerase